MKNILVIKDADFSADAVEKVNIKAPTANIIIAVGGTVTIVAPGATNIFYTTNGFDPTTSSTTYTEPFTVAAGTTVKAIAEYSGGRISDVLSATYNAGGSEILYKLNYTQGFSSSSSNTLEEISKTGYAISDFIPVPSYSNLNVNFGANVQTLGMWDEYYEFKIVEYDKNHNVVVSTEARANSFGTSIPVGNNCIWSIRDGQHNVDYKGIPTQRATRYIKIVVKLGTSANVVDLGNNNNVLFQYIPA